MPRICLYSPADLNLVSGSSIWVQAVAETLHADPGTDVVLPLRAPERRRLITDQLRRLPRVTLVDPSRHSPHVPPSGLWTSQMLDLIERLDREARFDAIILRSFALCLQAIDRPALRDRIWATYALEPERDLEDTGHLADLRRIAEACRWVVVQSEGMRALLEAALPEARGRTIILPPAVPPPDGSAVPAPAQRLVYAGKFHPFYPVDRMIDMLTTLRAEWPDLEFDVLGDQIARPPGLETWADELERRLATTEGVVWHGAVARHDAARLLARGGVALSLWDYRYGSHMNDLVVSTKLLDYCAAGLPVILNRTVAQEDILGADYPLFVRGVEEALPLLRCALADADLQRAAAERGRAAAARFAYPRVQADLAPYLEDRPDSGAHLVARPKLPASGTRVGLPLRASAEAIPAVALEAFAAATRSAAAHLVIGWFAPGAPEPPPGADPAAAHRVGLPVAIADRVSLRTVTDPPNWWRTLGIVFAPDDPLVDDEGVRVGAASGAIVARTAGRLADALAAAATVAPAEAARVG